MIEAIGDAPTLDLLLHATFRIRLLINRAADTFQNMFVVWWCKYMNHIPVPLTLHAMKEITGGPWCSRHRCHHRISTAAGVMTVQPINRGMYEAVLMFVDFWAVLWCGGVDPTGFTESWALYFTDCSRVFGQQQLVQNGQPLDFVHVTILIAAACRAPLETLMFVRKYATVRNLSTATFFVTVLKATDNLYTAQVLTYAKVEWEKVRMTLPDLMLVLELCCTHETTKATAKKWIEDNWLTVHLILENVAVNDIPMSVWTASWRFCLQRRAL